MVMTGPVSWVANLSSSAELSPFLGAKGFPGKRMSLKWYSFSHCTLACRDIVVLLHLFRSTEISVIQVTFLWMTLNSSKLKPLLDLTLVWYLIMGHLTMGWMGWDTEAGNALCFGLLGLVSEDLLGILGHFISFGHHGCCLLAFSEGEWPRERSEAFFIRALIPIKRGLFA